MEKGRSSVRLFIIRFKKSEHHPSKHHPVFHFFSFIPDSTGHAQKILLEQVQEIYWKFLNLIIKRRTDDLLKKIFVKIKKITSPYNLVIIDYYWQLLLLFFLIIILRILDIIMGTLRLCFNFDNFLYIYPMLTTSNMDAVLKMIRRFIKHNGYRSKIYATLREMINGEVMRHLRSIVFNKKGVRRNWSTYPYIRRQELLVPDTRKSLIQQSLPIRYQH